MTENFSYFHRVSNFQLIKFFLAYLLTRAKDPVGKASPEGNELTPETRRTALNQKDPMWLTLRQRSVGPSPPTCMYPPTFALTFPYINLGSIFRALEVVLETLVHSLPGGGLTEIHSCLVSPPLTSLPLAFVSGEWWNLVPLAPEELAAPVALHPHLNYGTWSICKFPPSWFAWD